MYRWCMYSFLSFNPYFCLLYRHFAIGDHYALKHNLLNIVMLNSLAIYWNLKLLINFLFCIIQKRAIKFLGEHFSIRIKTPSRNGIVTKAIIKHYCLKLNLYIKFAKGKIMIPRKMLTNSFHLKILGTRIWTQKYIVFGDLQISLDCLVSENVIRWMPQGVIDNKLTLVQVMAWCSQASTGLILLSCC